MIVDFPEFPLTKVFVGGCIARGEGSSFRASAHAHNSKTDKHFGTTCIRSKKPDTLRLPNGEPSNLMKHEYAHILCPNEGHTRKYWTVLAKIGGFMEREDYFGHKAKDFLKMRVKWEQVSSQVANNTLEL